MTVKKFVSILLVLFIFAALLAGCVGAAGGAAMPQQQATWTHILGLLVPILAVGIMQLGWTKEANSLVALGITIGVAVLDAYYFGQLNSPDNLVQTVFNILVAAITTYKTIWEPLGVIDWWAEKTTLRRYSIKFIGDAKDSPYGLPW